MPDKTRIHTVYKNAQGVRLPSVTTALGILGKPALIHWAWEQGVAGLDYRAVRDNAADIGTLAHYLIMCDIKKETPDISEYSRQDIDKAEACLIKYWDWAKAIRPIMIEEPLVSEQYQYGGTIDLVCIVNDTLCLVDFKTGKAIYDEYAYQLAAYQQLLREKGIEPGSVRILRIGRDEAEGFEERTFKNLDRHWQVFYNCLRIYNLQREIGRAR